MKRWQPFENRKGLDYYLFQTVWRHNGNPPNLFLTDYHIGKLPREYCDEIIERFKNDWLVTHAGLLKEQGLTLVDCCVSLYTMRADWHYICAGEPLERFVSDVVKELEEKDKQKYKESRKNEK